MHSLVADAVRALQTRRLAVLPDVGADWALLGRAAHRGWLAAGGRGPLLAIDVAHVRDAEDVRDAARAVGDGLLHLGPGVECPVGLGVLLLRHGNTRAVVEEALRRLDAVHAVAVDPTLARARAALLAHARAAEVVYLRGPEGSGRASLARWAAAALDAPSLVEITPDRPAHAPPGAWILFRELEEVGAERLGPLRARLAAPTLGWGGGGVAEPPAQAVVAGIVGQDRAFCEVLATAVRHAPTTAPVLILGESGTGKEPLARLVHDASGRRGPFVPVDLASRNENLIEDDLFGHVPGAFEGARAARDGAFRRAHRGTLFLDELGNLPLAAQVRLLRVLELGQVQPLGSDASHPVDVRVVAATNADIEGMVHAGTFRRDLYHRLAGIVLRLPPLRDRGEDVTLLAEHFARRAGAGGLADDAHAALRARPWSGNVRELRQVVEVAAREARGSRAAPQAPDASDRDTGGVPAGDLGGRISAAHLRIAPTVPLFVTGTSDVLERPSGLARREAQALAALSVVVAAPAERGEACLRSAILAGLGGRPITPDALRLLVAWPWWGNFVEIERKLRALRAASPGPVDTASLAALFPEIGAGATREPIVSLLSPSVRDDGGVAGWKAAHHDAALVVGRARARADLDDDRRRWLARRVDSLGFLAFPNLAELSRAHVLVERHPAGLVVSLAPGAALPTLAGPLDGAVVPVDEPVVLGRAGELRVLRDGEPVLQLFLFAGEAALAEAEPLLRARLAGAVDDTRRAARPARAWAVSPEEIALLNTIVVGFVEGDGDFAPHLRAALMASESPALRAALLSSHPTQSCARLYQSPLNGPLRVDLVGRLRAEGLVERAGLRLPTNLRAAIEDEGG
ncbi:MAG: sigma 54-interacting transcriptional regulator [Pseudomonadota bacterium]|nr:sigma 54-interacting transcriptional regulator [Pseudomonadota bacterium]